MGRAGTRPDGKRKGGIELEYTLNDATAYGIYNGLGWHDVRGMIREEAEALGIGILDYSAESVAGELNRDPGLEAIARAGYRPYPAHDGWSREYRAMWDAMAEKGEAPGRGEVPDDAVRSRLRAVLGRIAETVTAPRKEKEAAERARRAQILSHVAGVRTEARDVTDEGGPATEYVHHVAMPSGRTYVFLDRDVFDAGRAVTLDGSLLVRRDGKLGWSTFVEGSGWDFRPAAEDDEAVLAYRAAALYGHAGGTIRM